MPAKKPIAAAELRRVVRVLPEWPPVFTKEWEAAVGKREKKNYRSEQAHLDGWLSEYGGTGAYGRKNPGQDARFFYTHFKDYYGLAWLAEALGVDATRVCDGYAATKNAGKNLASQCGAFRRVIPWEDLEPLI